MHMPVTRDATLWTTLLRPYYTPLLEVLTLSLRYASEILLTNVNMT
jgi:hypothetical protein